MGHIRATLACWSLVFVFLEVVCLEVLAVAFRADSPDLFAVDVFIEGQSHFSAVSSFPLKRW